MNRINFAFGSNHNDEFLLLEIVNGKPNVIARGLKENCEKKKTELEDLQNKKLKKYVVRKSSNIWA